MSAIDAKRRHLGSKELFPGETEEFSFYLNQELYNEDARKMVIIEGMLESAPMTIYQIYIVLVNGQICEQKSI